MKLTTRAALAFTAVVAVLLPLSQPAAAAQPEVSTVSSLGEYYAAFKAGRAAKVVAYEPTYGALVGRGPNGEETHVLDVENWGTADRSRV